MERVERIFRLHALLKAARHGLRVQQLMEELQASRATVYRDIAFLRDALMAPIETDSDQHRICYAPAEQERFELPGLWLTPDQLYALVLAQELLGDAAGTPFADILGSLGDRTQRVLGDAANELKRVRVLRSNVRKLDAKVYAAVASSVLRQQALGFQYRARSTNERTRRQVYPQRLTHYRDNWYLDAWDDRRRAMRSFALDRISAPETLDLPKPEIPDNAIQDFNARGYGIFSAPTRDVAVIRFSAHAARWVADEVWHPKQEGRALPDGGYELKIPFGHPRELLMDVLRYGADAEIVAPVALRQQMKSMLQLTISNYE